MHGFYYDANENTKITGEICKDMFLQINIHGKFSCYITKRVYFDENEDNKNEHNYKSFLWKIICWEQSLGGKHSWWNLWYNWML